jgi:glycosyltransferase involved in cell wall biosynthesis
MKPKFFITTTVARSLPFFSGQPQLWKQYYDVTAIAAEKDKLREFAATEEVGYRYIPMHREISLWSDIVCLFRFILLFIKERPYLVHGNTPKASMLSMLAAWITRRPIRIYMCHGLRYQGTQGKLRKLLMVMEKIACSCATHVISVSKGVADIMVADGLCKSEKMMVVGHGSAGGVDMEKFNPDKVERDVRKELGIPEDAFVFAFVGRIVGDKGVNELVGAFSRIKEKEHNVHLLLVGPKESVQDPISEKTAAIIDNNPSIHAMGMQQDVRPYLKATNAFMLPSYREGFGMVLIEAGAMGLPCITTNITGCNEIIIPGENGAIVEPRDEEALYKEMKKWVENPNIVKTMAAKSRKMVEDRYECHKVWNLYFDKYKSL